MLAIAIISICLGWYVDHSICTSQLRTLNDQRETIATIARLRTSLYSHKNAEIASDKGLTQVRNLNLNQLVYDIIQLAGLEYKFGNERPVFPTEDLTSTECLVHQSLKTFEIKSGEQFIEIASGIFDGDWYPHIHSPKDPANQFLTKYVDRCLQSKYAKK